MGNCRRPVFEREIVGLLEELKRLMPVETIDGANVEETAGLVDLDIAYKLLFVPHCVQQEDFELYHRIPFVVEAQKRPDGRYELRFQTEVGPDFQIITANEAKVMRARFLLLKGFYARNFDKLTLPKQNEVAAKYDIGFIPDILKT